MTEVSFQTGPYGEIYPPPFLSHVTPEDAWRRFSAFSASIGAPLDGPQNDAEKPIWYNLAAIYCHQMRLREVIAGTAENETIEESAIRLAVQHGYSMSIRPLGSENSDPKTFAPILTRLEDDLWRIGAPDNGRTLIFDATPADVIERAQHLYTEWKNEEDEVVN